MDVHESLLDAVGSTPLLRLRRVTAGLAPAVYVELEFLNPGGSVEDRAALAMVRAAEACGDLPPGGGGVIVEGPPGTPGWAWRWWPRSMGSGPSWSCRTASRRRRSRC